MRGRSCSRVPRSVTRDAGEALTVTATPLAGGRELAVTVSGETLALPLSA